MQTLDAIAYRKLLDDSAASVTDGHNARALLFLDDARRMLLTNLSQRHENAREKR